MKDNGNEPIQFHTTRELKGKPVISADSGKNIGSVEDVMVDPQELRVAGLVTSRGGLIRRTVEAIPAEAVQLWGQDAVLVDHAQVIREKEELPGYDGWLSVADELKGRSVIGIDGTRLGQLDDVIINPSGDLVGYELAQTGSDLFDAWAESSGMQPGQLPVVATHSLGPDVLIVDLGKAPDMPAEHDEEIPVFEETSS